MALSWRDDPKGLYLFATVGVVLAALVVGYTPECRSDKRFHG